MTPSQVAELLSVAAAFDQRTIGEFDIGAWHAAIGDLDFDDARASLVAHYRDRRDRVMPADIRQRVIDLRRSRLAAVPDPVPDVDPDDPAYFHQLRANRLAVASGHPAGSGLRLTQERPS